MNRGSSPPSRPVDARRAAGLRPRGVQALRSAVGLGLGALSFVYLIFILNPVQLVASVVVMPFSRRAVVAVNRWCARSIWGFWVLLAERINGTRIRFTGDEVPRRENAILIANHQSMSDVLVLLCFAWRCGRVGDIKWFVKDIIKYVPGPGWGMWLLGCVFLKRDWRRDQTGIQRRFRDFRLNQIPVFLVSFLEGTRRTAEKLARSQAYARTRGLYVGQNTLTPRTKGFAATVDGLKEHVDAVYDLTLGYREEPPPTLFDCFAARVRHIDVHVRRFAIDSLPECEGALSNWVFERFREKDELMEAYRRTQTFAGHDVLGSVRVRDWFLPERAT